MALLLPAFPDLPCFRVAVTLGPLDGPGEVFVLRFTYRTRTASWYVDVFESNGETLLLAGRRLSPGWSPHRGIVVEGMPDGVLYVRGRDEFERDDLGTDNLRVVFFDAEEIATRAGADPTPLYQVTT